MVEYADIALSDLIVDVHNARLKDEQPNEQAALLAVARQNKRHLLNIATDIVEHGLDPLAVVAVVPTDDQQKRYFVLEGNRRVVALKALETPSTVSAVLSTAEQSKLNRLAERFRQHPISSVMCALFSSEEELEHWTTLRHTGQNNGIGLVEWGAEEKDRYTARHGKPSPAGEIMDFVMKQGGLSEHAQDSSRGIITNLKRLINTPRVREVLGIEISEGHVSSQYPADEVAKGLTCVVEDLKTGEINVNDIRHEQQRLDYIESFPVGDRPDATTKRDTLRHLQDAENTGTRVSEAPPSKPRGRRGSTTPRQRTAVIPRSCRLDIDPPRINNIYNELLRLSADQYTNACSVTLRVFVELNVDHYLKENKLMTENDRRKANLAKRLKTVADDLEQKGEINAQLRDAVYRIADNPRELAPSTMTFNQYVHNEYVFPRAGELRTAWDELQPFIEKLWP